LVGGIMEDRVKTELEKIKRFKLNGGDTIEFKIVVNGGPIFLADKYSMYEEDYPFLFLDKEPQVLTVPYPDEWEFEIKFIKRKNVKK
jgi:hypothetical protein